MTLSSVFTAADRCWVRRSGRFWNTRQSGEFVWDGIVAKGRNDLAQSIPATNGRRFDGITSHNPASRQELCA